MKIKKLLFLSIAFFMLLPFFARADETTPAKSISVYVFTQQGCPYCAEVLSFLEELKQTYPGIAVFNFDMKIHPEYVNAYAQMAQAYGISTTHVPVTYIGAKAIEGANESTIKEAIEYCFLPVNQCIDPGKYIQEATPIENNAAGKTNQEIVGWVVIGLVTAGGVALLIFKFR
ncbi:hypothetical protein HZB94_00155 [Candidatus Falkowbacteria bacterium]|nr:hypothetical protein [Candidatus Falkowbacteria bacterium]